MINKKALILVDLQNDFCEGGQLAVFEADAVIAVANQLQPHFDLVVATQDWHPADHLSFASNHPGYAVGDHLTVDNIDQVLWPDHCVQNSYGAAFHPDLDTDRVNKIIHKGIDRKIDSYSAFFDNAHKRSTGLSDYLQQQQVDKLYILGLATDYCVKYSTLDALHLGYDVTVMVDGCRGVELQPGDTEAALTAMRDAGAKLITSGEFFRHGK